METNLTKILEWCNAHDNVSVELFTSPSVIRLRMQIVFNGAVVERSVPCIEIESSRVDVLRLTLDEMCKTLQIDEE